MGTLKDLFGKIKDSFIVRKTVTFDELGITLGMEPLSISEELKIMEACKDFEGASYIEALKKNSLAYSIKKINDVEFGNDPVEYEDDAGKKVTETKYLFLLHQIETWPSALRDMIFEAYNGMQLELEARVNKTVQFERYTVQTKTEEPKTQEAGVPAGFKKVEEPKETGPVDEIDKLNKAAKDEVERAQAEIDAAGQVAGDRFETGK